MAIIDINIVDREQLLVEVTVPTVIEQVVICNTSPGTITVSLFKLVQGTETRFYIINAIELAVKETFVLEDTRLESSFNLYVGISGGSASVNLTYFQ